MGKLRNFIDVLTQDEVLKMHREMLAVLEKTGMRVPHDGVLAKCKSAGFIVDDAMKRVRFPSTLVDELLRVNKPKQIPEGPVERVKGNISTQVFIVDYPGNVQRKGELKDVRRGIMVSDRLMNYYCSSAVVIPADLPADRTDIASYREINLYSRRPGGTYILSPETGRGIIEMGRVMGKKNGYLLETVSPLGYMNSSLEMARIFAEAGMPIGVAPMVISGVSGPMTIWGSAVLEIAEITGTNLIIYALTGQFQNCMSFASHTMDMRTTLCSFGSPNQAMLGLIAGQMGRFYGWGSGSNSALADACMPDYQCGFEKALNGVFALLGGTTGIGAQGIVGADQGISLEQLVLDNDWMDAYNHVAKGVEYDPEALELIDEIGIAGTFMSEEHTVEHMREVFWEAPSRCLWRDQWERWKEADHPDIYAQAHEFVEESIRGWETLEPVISPSMAEEIERIYRETIARLDR